MRKVLKIFLHRVFIPVNRDFFRLGTSVDFDCYVQKFSGFTCLVKAGTYIDEKIYKQIIAPNLKLLVTNESFKKYKNYLEEQKFLAPKTKTFIPNKKIFSFKKISNLLSKTTIEDDLKDVYEKGKLLFEIWESSDIDIPKEPFVNLANDLSFVVETQSVTLLHFNQFMDNTYHFATHCLNVAFYASILGKQLGYDSQELQNLILAALLHDSGKKKILKDSMDRHEDLSLEELEKIKTHPLLSVQSIKEVDINNPKILQAILEHHEYLDGSGYPKGLTANEISEYAKILAICDVFDVLTTAKSYTTYEALMLIKKEYSKKLDLNYITILIKLLH